MNLVVPNFELTDVGSRGLDARFLLDTRLGSSDGVLRYSDGVKHAVRMLSNPNDRKAFVRIARILAFSEMQTRNDKRLRPVGWNDIASLDTQLRDLR